MVEIHYCLPIAYLLPYPPIFHILIFRRCTHLFGDRSGRVRVIGFCDLCRRNVYVSPLQVCRITQRWPNSWWLSGRAPNPPCRPWPTSTQGRSAPFQPDLRDTTISQVCRSPILQVRMHGPSGWCRVAGIAGRLQLIIPPWSLLIGCHCLPPTNASGDGID